MTAIPSANREYYDADQPDPDWLEPFLRAGTAR